QELAARFGDGPYSGRGYRFPIPSLESRKGPTFRHHETALRAALECPEESVRCELRLQCRPSAAPFHDQAVQRRRWPGARNPDRVPSASSECESDLVRVACRNPLSNESNSPVAGPLAFSHGSSSRAGSCP